MAEEDPDMPQAKLESDVRDMQLKEEHGDVDMEAVPEVAEVKKEEPAGDSDTSTPGPISSTAKKQSRSPSKVAEDGMDSPSDDPVKEETVGGGVELKLEPGKAPKLTRKATQKVERRPPPLFLDYDDSTAEATSTFAVISECVYANKYMGSTEQALECDCSEEWDPVTRKNLACGEDSDCINRATKMECDSDCGCGERCQNQRFLRKQWADVSVIKTEKKGYGLRCNVDLRANDFIFEYVGEVLGEGTFHRRRQLYHDEGIKHFYFMSLNKGEFVDATKKGNLGRFCNHSCNPNCYVDKWVVDDKLRMGIFAERAIQAGEELVFNYNVDRYGADPQPCYCGEPNCTGYIGGKTQTERATKLSHATIEALGIDDADAWDTAVAKRPKKKKMGEDDEEYVNNFEPRGLDEEGVNKVMSSLMQCKEKWIAVKLLARIQRADDEKVRNRVVRFHGYRVLKTALSNFAEDVNVCLQILDVLDKMPRLTLNKIRGSRIEDTVQELTGNEDERVAAQSKTLLDSWSKLKMEYRIPKRDPAAAGAERKVERREGRRSRSRTKSKSPEPIQAPTGPRTKVPQRTQGFHGGMRPQPRFRPPPPGALPAGWFAHTAQNGTVYYYDQAGTTTWQRPTMPAAPAPPPPPSKAQTDKQMLEDLIQSIVSTKKEPAKPTSSNHETPTDTPKKPSKEEKLRSLPQEKQKKLYESALQPHIMHVVGKYKHKLAKDDLKRWAKELAKKIVDSDFKKGRVDNPSKVSDKQAKSVKKHAQEFFEKAVKKKEAADKRRAERKAKQGDDAAQSPAGSPAAVVDNPMEDDEIDEPVSDVEADEPEADPAESSANDSATRKRTHEDLSNGYEEGTSPKKPRAESLETAAPPPPPPPPPPPAEGDPMDAETPVLTPGEDVSGSFTHDAIAAVHDASFADEDPAAAPAESGPDIEAADANEPTDKGASGSNSRPGSAHGLQLKDELVQMATPPTTGSPDNNEEAEKIAKRQAFSGMSADRMKQLGLFDGAAE